MEEFGSKQKHESEPPSMFLYLAFRRNKMNFINTKFNRYIFPPICILLIVSVSFLFSINSFGEDSPFLFFGILIISSINLALYFLFQLISHPIIKNDFLSIFICSGFSFLLSGKLFRIMHWPGALFQLYTGVTLLSIAFLLSLLVIINRNKKS